MDPRLHLDTCCSSQDSACQCGGSVIDICSHLPDPAVVEMQGTIQMTGQATASRPSCIQPLAPLGVPAASLCPTPPNNRPREALPFASAWMGPSVTAMGRACQMIRLPMGLTLRTLRSRGTQCAPPHPAAMPVRYPGFCCHLGSAFLIKSKLASVLKRVHGNYLAVFDHFHLCMMMATTGLLHYLLC